MRVNGCRRIRTLVFTICLLMRADINVALGDEVGDEQFRTLIGNLCRETAEVQTKQDAERVGLKLINALNKAGADEPLAIEDGAIALQRLLPKSDELAPQSLPVLLELLQTTRSGTRCEVISAIGEAKAIGSPAIPSLYKLLASDSDVHDFEKIRAAAALVNIGGPDEADSGLKQLQKFLLSDSPELRCAAAMAIGSLDSAARPLLGQLQKRMEDQSVAVRYASARAVWRISREPSEELIHNLTEVFHDGDWTIFTKKIPPSGNNTSTRIGAIAVLSQIAIKDSRAAQVVLDGMKDEDTAIRILCIQGISRLPSVTDEMVAALRQSQKSSERLEREAANKAIDARKNASNNRG